MATRKIIDAKHNGEKVWLKSHAQATFMSDGATVEDTIKSMQTGSGGITSESDPIFSASPAFNITDENIENWNGKQDAILDLDEIRSGAGKGATAVQPSTLASVATSGDYSDLSNKPTIPTKLSDLSNDNILTCEFMGEVGDVIWSSINTDRIAIIHDWMNKLSEGKVSILESDEGIYAITYALNYSSDETYGSDKARFSYIFDGYLYEVEYDEVALPVTLTIISKTKIGGEGGSSSEGGSSAYPEVNHGTSDRTFTLTPNTFHVWDEVTSLNLTLGAETSGVANEYLFQFTSGSTPTTLTLPNDIKFSEDLVIEANKIYQISILKGLGSVLSWDNGVALIENKATITSTGNKATVTLQYAAASSLSIKVIHDDGSNTITIPVGEVSGSVNIMSPMISNLRISTITPEFDTNYIYVK